MSSSLDVFDAFSKAYAREKLETMSLRDYLLAARDKPMMYASPAERMIAAIGEPELIDTSRDSRLVAFLSANTLSLYGSAYLKKYHEEPA